MRVLLLTLAQKAHLYIEAPLAWALRTAGHEVCVVSQPDLAEELRPTGLTGVEVGRAGGGEVSTRMTEAEPDTGRSEALPRNPVQADYTRDDPTATLEAVAYGLYPAISPDDVFDDAVAFARRWKPDLVIWDMLAYAGPVVARASNAAHCRLVLATDGMAQLRMEFLARRADPGYDPMRDWLQPKLDRHGCGEFDEETVLGQWSIDAMPSWTWHPTDVRYVRMRHLAFNGSAIVPDWLFDEPERERVCITLGMSHRESGRPEASAGDLLEAVADLDVEVIATLDEKQLAAAGRLPDNVRAVDFVPLNALLPTCAAIVHHGGGGTFAGAVEHGVPQLISPSAWWTEKYYGPVAMANGVQEQGAGVYISDSDRLTAEALRHHLVRVLENPSFRENAMRLREEALRTPTPNDVVPVLADLTAQHRGA